jgi:hypothetical protein
MSTRTVTDRETFFVESQTARDVRCVAKDAIITKILNGIAIKQPKQFRAVLMPSMYGPEVAHLRARGVPIRNMFAIERDTHVHHVLRQRSTQRHDRGPSTTAEPLPIQTAVDHIPFATVNLIYLDFFSQPDGNHLKALTKLFRLGFCVRGTRLLTTFGTNRGDAFSCRLNARLRCASVGQAYIEAALKHADRGWYRRLINYPYVTDGRTAHFTTTEVRF